MNQDLVMKGFSPERHMSVSVTHRCGHSHKRPIKLWNKWNHRYEFTRSIPFLEQMNAKAERIEDAKKFFRQEASKIVQKWKTELCQECWMDEALAI